MDKARIFRAALTALRYVGADNIGPQLTNRVGAIFMLHHVGPETGREFEPNRILRVTPEFLEDVICDVKRLGYETISLDDVPDYIGRGRTDQPFVCFTFDDGYKDNLNVALPIFRRHNVPMTVYIPTDFMDGKGHLWWLNLERAIDTVGEFDIEMDGQHRHFDVTTTKGKYSAFNEVYWWLRRIPEDEARDAVSKLSESAGIDPLQLCRDLQMSWDQLKDFASDPVVTIGAHTKGHYALAKLPEERAFDEMRDSIDRIEHDLGITCRHFSFPYGDPKSCGPREFKFAKELGMKTAVTTQKGLIGARHADSLTALPRLSLNGDFQDTRYVRTLLSGAPFALLDLAKRATGKAAAA